MRRENRFHPGRWVVSAILCAGCTQRIPEQQPTPTPSLSQSVPPHAALVFSESKTPIESPDSSSDKLQWTSEGTIFMCHFSCDLAPLSAHGGIVLNPSYTPPNLVSINHLRNPALPNTTQLRATRETANALAMLTQDLRQKGLSITVNSAHRGYSEQIAVYSAQPSTSVPAGRSEHQLGNTVDLQYPFQSQQTVISTAYKYGFVATTLRDNLGVPPEPWHFRDVGPGILDEYEVWAANQRSNPGQSDSFQIFLSEKIKCTFPNARARYPGRCPRRKGGRIRPQSLVETDKAE